MNVDDQVGSKSPRNIMAPTMPGPYLGVLGGLGPMASAAFMARLTALTRAGVDQDHIPTILWSDPRVPDRTDAVTSGGADPFPALLNGVLKLKQAGAEAIAIVCNSAHIWHSALAKSVDIPVLHIATAVVDDLRARGMHNGRIGLMGGGPMLRARIYQTPLEDAGYECVVPHADEVDHFCLRPIRMVKANRIEEALPLTVECIELLRARGAEAVVLACTEYPIALPHGRRSEIGIPLVDSIDALAMACIEWYRSRTQGNACSIDHLSGSSLRRPAATQLGGRNSASLPAMSQ